MKRPFLVLRAAIIIPLIGFGCASMHRSAEPSTAASPAAAENKPKANPASPTPAQPESAAAGSIHLKLVKVDSEETSGEDGKAANALDGDPATFWHTQWQDSTPEPPHEIIIELTPPAAIKGFTYLPRQDESENGTIKDYEFFVSNDSASFGEPVAKGTFPNNKDKKTVTFNAVSCRFIKLKALSEANDGPWTSAAEIGVVPAD
jgi:hypothetical protein